MARYVSLFSVKVGLAGTVSVEPSESDTVMPTLRVSYAPHVGSGVVVASFGGSKKNVVAGAV